MAILTFFVYFNFIRLRILRKQQCNLVFSHLYLVLGQSNGNVTSLPYFVIKKALKNLTLPIAKILGVKNARAWVSMDFTYNKFSATRTIEKIKILGAVLQLLPKQHCQSSPFTSKLGQIGQIGSAV